MKKLFILGLAFIGAVSTEAVAMDNQSLKFGLQQVNTSKLDHTSLNILGKKSYQDREELNFAQMDRDDRYDNRGKGHKAPPPPHHDAPPSPHHHDAPPPPPHHDAPPSPHHHDAPPPPPHHDAPPPPPHHDAPPPPPRR